MIRRKPLMIIGSGCHACVVAEAAVLMGYREIYFYDPYIEKGYLRDYPIVKSLKKSDLNCQVILGIAAREIRFRALKQALELFDDRDFVEIRHPSSVVSSSANIGRGCFLGANSVVGPGAVLGENTIINSGAIVEHDVFVDSQVSFSPGAIACGGARIGSYVDLYARSLVLPSVIISNNSILGAGSVLMENALIPGLYLGTPAEMVRTNDER